MELDRTVCDRARRSRDARFDGKFFIAVTSTRFYCRPICPARAPKDGNVRYFATAAAAQAAGFRPCLRCRPEASPGTPAWFGTSSVVSRALRLIGDGALDRESVEQLADRVGIMVAGKLVALESVSALRDELTSAARLRVTMESARLSLIEAATQAGATDVVIDGNSLIMSTRPEDRLQILRAIENGGGKIRSFGMEELSLEDVYMKYVNEESVDAK